MVKKRLDRDYKWYLQEYFQELPYYQMRIDIEEFHGFVGVIELTDNASYFCKMPKAGKTPLCGKGMLWRNKYGK